MCGCNTSSATTAANPDAQAAYTDVVGKAQSVASTPYSPYTGQLVAPLNGGQNQAVRQLAGSYGTAQPYIDQGSAGLGNVQQYLQGGSQGLASAADFGTSSAKALSGLTPYMQMVQDTLGTASGAFGQEASGLGAAGNYFSQAAGLATPQNFDASAVSQYMSPYLSSVVDATRANLDESDAQQRTALTASAIGNGAYGGDRAGVAQAELARQQDLADGQTIANLYNTGYSNAESQFNAVQGQRQQGASLLAGLGSATTQNALGYGNVGSGLLGAASGYNTLAQDQGQIAQQYGTLGNLALGQASGWGSLGTLQGTTGQAYGTLGSLAQSNLISGASAGLQGATLGQQNAQQQDTAAYNQYMAGLSYPYQNVGFLSNIVQGIGSQEGNTQTTQGNALSSIAGLGTSAIGILGATGGFGANGYLSSLGSTFSDARVKENIAPIGTTHDGQAIYRYNYKGGDPRDVKLGLMAQDVERRDPGAVGAVGGIKTVDYDRATRGAAAIGLGTPSPVAGGSAERLGFGLAARMARAAGGSVPGLGMPAPMMPTAANLGTRPHFAEGGGVDPSAPIPAAGLNVSPAGLTAGAGINLGTPLGAGRPIQAPPAGGGQGLGALTAAPGTTGLGMPSPGGFGGGAGLGTPAPGSPPSAGGLSQNAWMGVLAAGLGMMGGTSASATANIGRGALEGLQMYQGLQQQDRSNGFKAQELALDRQRADSDASYKQGSLGLQSRDIDLRVKQLETEVANQQRQAAIQSGQLANQTANTQSEIATRDQQNRIARYQQFFVPGVGSFYRDLTNPGAPPISIGAGQGAPVAPPPSATPPAAQPTTGAPLPSGDASTSGAPPSSAAGFGGGPGQGNPAATPSGASNGGARPQAGSALSAVQVPQGWQPTTTVPQSYVPANSMNIAMSGDGGKSQAELGQKEVEGLQTSASKATNAQAQLYQMNAAVDGLPKTGIIAPGTFGDERAKLALGLNAIAQTFGAQPVISPDQAADLQEVQKGAFRLGTQMITDTNGGREAGFILQNSVRNVPSLNNNYLGFKRVAAGIDQANQYVIDKSNFVSDYFAKYHHTDGADALFAKLNPWQNYAQRAIDSSTMPTSRPGNVPQGSQYSMSAQMWRDPQGNLYGRDGQAVRQ